jgi:C-terminal binding protein
MREPLKVLITDFVTDSLEPERRVLGELAEVSALDARSEEDLWGRVEDADALIVYHNMSIGRATLDRLRRCRLIVRGGVGVDNVDHAYARSRGIAVANVPDYGSEEVADSAIGMLLSLTRGISLLNSRLRDGEGEWIPWHARPLARLRGRRCGVVGLGRIGTAFALRAKVLGLDVAFYDPFKPDGYDKALGTRRVETLAELLGEAEILSLHCPLTAQTRHLVDAGAIERMPMGSYLVNTSRGAVLDTACIPAAIESGRLAGAAIDVLEQEPPLDESLVRAWRDPGHPAHERVIINPHAAFYSEEGLAEIRTKSAQACLRLAEGVELRNVVN